MTKQMKQFLLILMLWSASVQAAPLDHEARITQLEQQVARLTEQVNQLLAERLHQQTRPKNAPIYECSLNAFTDTYRVKDSNRAKARLAVIQKCRQEHSEMFCEDSAVQCKTYQ